MPVWLRPAQADGERRSECGTKRCFGLIIKILLDGVGGADS